MRIVQVARSFAEKLWRFALHRRLWLHVDEGRHEDYQRNKMHLRGEPITGQIMDERELLSENGTETES
jgi:hypothetical protein